MRLPGPLGVPVNLEASARPTVIVAGAKPAERKASVDGLLKTGPDSSVVAPQAVSVPGSEAAAQSDSQETQTGKTSLAPPVMAPVGGATQISAPMFLVPDSLRGSAGNENETVDEEPAPLEMIAVDRSAQADPEGEVSDVVASSRTIMIGILSMAEGRAVGIADILHERAEKSPELQVQAVELIASPAVLDPSSSAGPGASASAPFEAAPARDLSESAAPAVADF